jgi:hypothetical protein
MSYVLHVDNDVYVGVVVYRCLFQLLWSVSSVGVAK